MTPFGTWLAEIDLGNYADVFAANKIDFDVILDPALIDQNVKRSIHRHELALFTPRASRQ